MSVRRVVRTAIPALLALAAIVPEEAAARGGSPAAPTNLRITATTSSSATLAWDAPKSGAEPSYYAVRETPTWNNFTVKPPQTTFARTRLSANVPYTWVVYAVDKSGKPSADSNTVSYKTPPDTTPPSAPTLSALYVGPKLVELDWTDSVDDTGSGVTYLVNRNGSSTPYGGLSYAVVGLAPSTSYSISVTARDNSGNAATSNTISVTTPAADNTSPPSPPGNLQGFAVANCEGWLSWGASADDVDPPSAIRYEAYVNGQFDSTWFGNTSTFVYATQNGTNTFTIVAFDSSGNKSQSSVDIHDMWLC
jgi:chitinase